MRNVDGIYNVTGFKFFGVTNIYYHRIFVINQINQLLCGDATATPAHFIGNKQPQ